MLSKYGISNNYKQLKYVQRGFFDVLFKKRNNLYIHIISIFFSFYVEIFKFYLFIYLKFQNIIIIII